MIDDRLDKQEAIRNECLIQALDHSELGTKEDEIIQKAKRFEKYIKGEQ